MTPAELEAIRGRVHEHCPDNPCPGPGTSYCEADDAASLLAELDRLREAATKAAAELRHAIGVRHASGHTQWGLIDRAVRLLESATTPGEKP